MIGGEHVRHLEVPSPNWDTKLHCACGDRFASRAEFWKHQADAYVSLVGTPVGRNPLLTAQDVCMQQGIDRQRLSDALAAKDNWGKMIHAFEFLTASSAVLATWPEDTTND